MPLHSIHCRVKSKTHQELKQLAKKNEASLSELTRQMVELGLLVFEKQQSNQSPSIEQLEKEKMAKMFESYYMIKNLFLKEFPKEKYHELVGYTQERIDRIRD